MSVYAIGDRVPQIDEDSWIAPGAHVVGSVTIEEGVGIWFGAQLRSDHEEVRIGAHTNIQENCVVHADPGFPAIIGQGCTIGHKVMLHGCEIGDNTLVGMGAVILNGAKIGKNCLVGAGALITEGKEFPDGSLIVGAPAVAKRQLDDAAIEKLRWSARHYEENMRNFRANMREV